MAAARCVSILLAYIPQAPTDAELEAATQPIVQAHDAVKKVERKCGRMALNQARTVLNAVPALMWVRFGDGSHGRGRAPG